MGAITVETCGNCGDKIGKLETPHVYREQVVCSVCFTKLSPPLEYRTPDARPVASLPVGRVCEECKKPIASNATTCPFCGKQYTSSVTWMVLLVIALILLALAGHFVRSF